MMRDDLLRLRAWIDALLAAQAAADEPEPEQPEKPDLDAWRTSVRNRILAGSGDKAALLGTLSTEPTIRNARQLADLLGFEVWLPDEAEPAWPSWVDDFISECSRVRARALELDSQIGLVGAVPKLPVR